ncbi:putative glycoside hydrolase [Fusobacterium sp.]|uniref:putative glycoside hydrolase n=1 Tax=Fusobacterium sp. TaxID=68766 RepID=UPI0026140819|nr:putative glycoside hydrolase [Fusobacterium sp.]
MKFFNKKNFFSIISIIAISLTVVSCKSSNGETIPTEKVETIIEEEKIPPKEFLFSTNLKTTVYDSFDTKKSIDTIGKNTRVLVVERKDVEIIKENKTAKKTTTTTKVATTPKKPEKPFLNDDEKVKINFSETKKEPVTTETVVEEKVPTEPKEYEHWVHVKYRKNLKERDGWILEKYLISDTFKNLPKSWEGMQLNNFPEKVEFPDNPRVDVKGVYLTVYSASLDKKLDSLIQLAKETKINAFVIDVKDDGGQLLWKMDDSILKYNPKAFSRVYIKDINAFMKKLKDNNIYTIARIVSFKDPVYAKQNPDKAIIEKKTGKPFMNKDGIIWVSPHDKNLWEYNIAVAKEAAKVGFNEVQFDYVRFPASNGGKLDAYLDYRNPENDSKPVTIQKYLKYAWEELTPLHVYINADIYGQIGTFKDDMGLGQYWEAISGYVHYVSPMMYPSHYINGAYGLPVPDAEPYKTIYYCTLDSINRNENIDNPAQIRPWIQDFTARWVKGHITYDVNAINAQIKALEDLGIHQYLLWSPSNKYHMEKITK